MKIKVVKKLNDKGYPTHNSKYYEAHSEALVKEKKKFPKGYAKLKKAEKSLGKHELMGKNTKKGTLEVEKKFAPYKKEIIYHESQEHKALQRLSKKRRKPSK